MSYAQDRVDRELYSGGVKQLPEYIKSKEKELAGLKSKSRGKFKVLNKLHGISNNKKFTNKKLIHSSSRATIVENQPVYSQDRSRFFNDSVQEDRRQLYFS